MLRGLVFGTLFLPHFGDQRTSFFFKRNDAEAYVWPKSDTRQAQQKLRLNLAYNITNLRKKLPKAQTSVKSNVTSQNKNLENKLRHDKALGGIESYGFMYGEAWATPTYPLKSCLARILGRKFSQVIGSNQTQQKHCGKGFAQTQQKYCKTHFNHKTILHQTRSFTGTDLKAVARQEEWRRDASRQSRCQAVWILHITASHLVQNCTSIDA